MKKTTRRNLSIFYVVPVMSILLLFLVIPLIYALYCSPFNPDYLAKGEFLGLGNHILLLKSSRVIKSLNFTFMITIVLTALSVTIDLILALWIDRKEGLFAYLTEVFGLTPWVISMMVAALLWRRLLNGDPGLFSMILRGLGFDPIYMVQNKTSVIIALVSVLVWRLVGCAMIMTLADLKGLDTTLIEAAKVDGASLLQLLRYIKLPLVKTSVLLSTIVLIVSSFTNNTMPKVLTSDGLNGTINVIALYQYSLRFRYYQFGTSATLSVTIMLTTSLIIVLYIRLSDCRIQEG